MMERVGFQLEWPIEKVKQASLGSVVTIVTVGLLLTTTLFPWLNELRLRISGKPVLRLPPGPKGYPLVGNLFDRPKSYPWRTWLEWTRKYGPIISVKMGGQVFIIIGNHKVAQDLLDKRSGIYSDRPRNIVAGEYAAGGKTSLFMAYGPRWRSVRKLMHHGLNVKAAETYQPIQQREVKVLLHDLINRPTEFESSFHRYTTSIVIEILYGRRVPTSSDKNVSLIKKMVARLITAAQPGAYLVDIIPILDLLPDWLAGWRVEARKWYDEMAWLFVNELQLARERIEKGTANASFVQYLDTAPEKDQVDDVQKAFVAGDLYAAGAETTGAVLCVFVMAMALYPEVQVQAQEELDRVVGKNQLPTFEHWDKLPYIKAIVEELHRWRPVGPIGFPHRLIQDDVYQGYKIPKGSMIIYNIWAINRDETVYPNGEQFDPSRFLDKPRPPSVAPFGYGRRICPGRDVAQRSLFIVIASILATMQIEKAKRADGSEIEIDALGFVDSGVSPPLGFQANLVGRSSEHAELIKSSRKKLQL